MEARPPALIEALVGRFIPPDAREPVSGDLHERYSGVAQYLIDAVRVVPQLVLERMLRVLRWNYVFLASELGVFVVTAIVSRGRYARTPPTLRWMIPAAATFLALLVRDAYIDVGGAFATGEGADEAFAQGLARGIKDALIAVACGWLAEFVVMARAPRDAMPLASFAGASGAWLLMLAAMRAAWWTVYVPGTQRTRLADLPRDRNPSESELEFRYRWLRQTSLGQFAWLVVVLPVGQGIARQMASEGTTWLSLHAFATEPIWTLAHVWFIVVMGTLSWRVIRGVRAGMKRAQAPTTVVEYREAVEGQWSMLNDSRLRLWEWPVIGSGLVLPLFDAGQTFLGVATTLVLTSCALALAAEVSSRTMKRLQDELDALGGF